MKFLALDLAAVTGFAVGDSGSMPTRSGSVRMRDRGEAFDVAVRNLACFIRDIIVTEPIGAIVVEAFLDPSVLSQARSDDEDRMRRSPDAVIAQIKMHGCVLAMCGLYGLRFESHTTQTIRKHFLGVAHANAGSRGKKTAKQKDEMRRKTKEMVMQRAKLLGYMPKDKNDDNFADACAIYDFASAVLFRKPVKEAFAMFGGA